MSDDPCQKYRDEVRAAALEWKESREQLHRAAQLSNGDPVQDLTPSMAGNLGSRMNETVSRGEAAKRRYRAAVRVLSECVRQHSGA